MTDRAVRAFNRLLVEGTHIAGPFRGMEDNAGRVWQEIREAAGIEDVTIHDLRRKLVTDRLRGGVPITVFKELAGHKSIATTERYYSLVTEDEPHEAVRVPRTGVA